MSNNDYGLYLSASLGGYSFNRNGHLLTRVGESQRESDRPGRFFYLRDLDTGETWNPSFQPTLKPLKNFESRHGLGYSILESEQHDITSSIRAFVPPSDPVELWDIKLTNSSKTKRRLSLFFVMEWADEFSSCTESFNTLIARSRRYPELAGFMGCDHAIDSIETDAATFFGRYHGYHNPQAIINGRLNRSQGQFKNRGVGVIEKKITLGANADIQLGFIAGLIESARPTIKIKALTEKYKNLAIRNQAFTDLAEEWKSITARHLIRTPEADLNRYYNSWATYQSHQASSWPELTPYGQSHPIQSLLSTHLADHIEIVAANQPFLAKEYLERLFKQQLKDGPVLEWANNSDLIDDNWPSNTATISLLTATANYLEEVGELTYLKTATSYFDGGHGTKLEHLNRAIKYLSSRLSQRYFLEIDNESLVYTAQFAAALGRITPLLEQAGDHHQARFCLELIEKIKKHLAKQWEGKTLPRQLSPVKIGTSKHKFHQTDLEVHIWTALSHLNDPAKNKRALVEVVKNLTTRAGVANFSPAYLEHDAQNPLSFDDPGTGENGGVIVKNNLLLARAFAYGQDGEQLIKHLIIPHYLVPETISTQPVTFGWTAERWSATAAGWWEKVILENLAGIQPTLGGLKIQPCLPRDWRSLEINRLFRGAEYHIRIHNPLRQTAAVDRIIVDGVKLTGNVIRPFHSGSHLVEVFLG